ncbi:MAG: dipeptidase [Pseudomonadota bacterium]
MYRRVQRRLFLCLFAAACAAPALAQSSASEAALQARVERVLKRSPLIDGHNDLAWELRERYASDLGKIDLARDTSRLPLPPHLAPDTPPLMTDIPRLRSGRVAAQFWSVWSPATVTGPIALKTAIEQIDLVKRMVQRYPADLALALAADDIERHFKAGRIASLIGVEGGHMIDNSLPALRQLHALGVRYLTLTHSARTNWADSGTADPFHNGLSPFGVAVVREMNRLGMLVDLSHVSPAAMKAALATSRAPVMVSHSNARALVDHPRNVPDDVLALIARNGGVVMVNFYPGYVSQATAVWDANFAAQKARVNSPPYSGLFIGQPERAKAALDAWVKANPAPRATLAMVADHLGHIRKVAGADSVGIGGDLDGIPTTPEGLEGVDAYPKLLVELARRGWSDDDLAKVAGQNILRVLRKAEEVARSLQARESPSIEQVQPGQ